MSEAPKEIWCSMGLYYDYKKELEAENKRLRLEAAHANDKAISDEPIYGGSIDADRLQYSIIDTAPPKSKWSIGPEFDITFFTPSPMPNWFHRTMQRLILGIHWKKADE